MGAELAAGLIAGALVVGRVLGARGERRRIAVAIALGRSPKTRALRAVLADETISEEHDR